MHASVSSGGMLVLVIIVVVAAVAWLVRGSRVMQLLMLVAGAVSIAAARYLPAHEQRSIVEIVLIVLTPLLLFAAGREFWRRSRRNSD